MVKDVGVFIDCMLIKPACGDTAMLSPESIVCNFSLMKSGKLPSICYSPTSKNYLAFDEHFLPGCEDGTIGDEEVLCNGWIRYEKLTTKPDRVQLPKLFCPMIYRSSINSGHCVRNQKDPLIECYKLRIQLRKRASDAGRTKNR